MRGRPLVEFLGTNERMPRAFSFGGGRQSTAALVLAAQGKIDVDVFVFANVGDDAENPATLAYVEQWAKPYAKAHSIELVEVHRRFKDGRDPSLYQHLLRQRGGDWVIPFRVEGRPANRKCTSDWKINVIARYLKQERRWPTPYVLALGISWDEVHRMRDGEDALGYRREYPLIEQRLTAADCLAIVTDAGLPAPPKSACWFCPFTDMASWARMRLNKPEQFEAARALEANLNARRVALGRDQVFLTDRMKPLDVAVPEGAEQLEMFEAAGACTSGYCWT